MSVIKTIDLKKEYHVGDTSVSAVNGIDIEVEKGDFLSIMGPSGCGKSTLLNLLGGLDKPTSGKVLIDDTDISQMSDKELSEIRCRKIGFVFQKFNLINEMTVKENIALPVLIDKKRPDEKHLEDICSFLGLSSKMDSTPLQLSGGQMQRVAIGRALSNDPDILLCDEPTGNLDRKTSENIIRMLSDIHEKYSKTIIIVTHDKNIAKYADKHIYMEDVVIKDIFTQ